MLPYSSPKAGAYWVTPHPMNRGSGSGVAGGTSMRDDGSTRPCSRTRLQSCYFNERLRSRHTAHSNASHRAKLRSWKQLIPLAMAVTRIVRTKNELRTSSWLAKHSGHKTTSFLLNKYGLCAKKQHTHREDGTSASPLVPSFLCVVLFRVVSRKARVYSTRCTDWPTKF